MQLWFDLLFGNPIGLAAVSTIIATAIILVFYGTWLTFKARETSED